MSIVIYLPGILFLIIAVADLLIAAKRRHVSRTPRGFSDEW